MKVTEVRVDLTRNGPKQYESDKVGLTATPNDGESISEIIYNMKGLILDKINDFEKGVGSSVTKTETETTEAPASSVKNSAVKGKEGKKQETKTGEATVSETKAPEKTEELAKEEEKVEEVKEQKEATKEEKKGKVKTTPAKTTPYDRNLDTHKKLLSGFLDANVPNWKKPENLSKAGDASKKLVGSPFLDAEGEILQSFKDSFLSYMK